MRITKIYIPESTTITKNLQEINLTKKPLGSTVALIGKNGAGKSRILGFVEKYIQTLNAENIVNGYIENIPSEIIGPYQKHLESAKAIMIDIESKNYSNDEKKKYKSQAINQIAPMIMKFQQLAMSYIKIVDNDDLKNIKNLTNNNGLTFEQILNNKHFTNLTQNLTGQKTQDLIINEFKEFNSQSTINYLTKLTNEIATDEFNLYLKNRNKPELVVEEIKKKKSYQLFTIFQDYVKKFLGKDFSYQQTVQGNTVNSTLHYNDQPFNINQFSPGQKTLFAYAILFFYLDVNSKTNIRDSIIIIDEPEKHLHPEAQISLINALKSIISKSGQLWLATHSIHILSDLDYDEIIMVEDNKIILPSRTTPGKSFNSLMGIENHISKLISFINSVSEWAYGNFMLQCFKEPDVIFSNDRNDPQFRLFKEFLINKSKTHLLDFGAGKGRIGYTIKEDEILSNQIIYSAFEPDKSNYELLNNVPKIKTTYSNIKDIPEKTFDCVLLCNVLHEINPMEWLESFDVIKKILKDDGYLLIIEDKFLPKGENAHPFGYLILGDEETKILLNSSDALELRIQEDKFNDRILFNAFTKDQINPNEDTILNSLLKLKENSFNNLKKIKKEEKNIDQGRRYANQTQLYINSQLAIEGIKK